LNRGKKKLSSTKQMLEGKPYPQGELDGTANGGRKKGGRLGGGGGNGGARVTKREREGDKVVQVSQTIIEPEHR